MSERENIKNMDGNLESLRRYENRISSGEEQLEKIQDEMFEDLDDLIEEFLTNVRDYSKRDDYDLYTEAIEYVKDNL